MPNVGFLMTQLICLQSSKEKESSVPVCIENSNASDSDEKAHYKQWSGHFAVSVWFAQTCIRILRHCCWRRDKVRI